MIIYKCDDYIVSYDEKDNYIVVKDFDFYKLNNKLFFNLFRDYNLTYIKTLHDNPFVTAFIVIVIISTLFIYFSKSNYTLFDVNFIKATLVLLLNIIIHEIGHILFLKVFYLNSRIKIGFKFIFIYPAFYVDTSYSYLLPKYKRIAVYLAGNFVNCLFILFVVFFLPSLLPYCNLVITNILVNLLPIIKSDGYYAFSSLVNKTNRKMDKNRERVDDFIRGAIMFCLLSFLSYII